MGRLAAGKRESHRRLMAEVARTAEPDFQTHLPSPDFRENRISGQEGDISESPGLRGRLLFPRNDAPLLLPGNRLPSHAFWSRLRKVGAGERLLVFWCDCLKSGRGKKIPVGGGGRVGWLLALKPLQLENRASEREEGGKTSLRGEKQN